MTDEQRMREHFEKWARIDRELDQYIHPEPEGAWRVFRSRDAEVQALRKLVDHAKRIFQNAEVRSGYCVCGETPERHDLYAEACQYVDRGQWESGLWLKREAAIARAEGGAE